MGAMLEPKVSLSTMVRLSKALGHPRAIMGNDGESADDALIQMAIDRLNPATAGEAEFQSWLYRLNARAIAYCPGTDQYHSEAPAPRGSGYAYVCTRCGHHTIFPF